VAGLLGALDEVDVLGVLDLGVDEEADAAFAIAAPPPTSAAVTTVVVIRDLILMSDSPPSRLSQWRLLPECVRFVGET
jgi:hypothetical protein